MRHSVLAVMLLIGSCMESLAMVRKIPKVRKTALVKGRNDVAYDGYREFKPCVIQGVDVRTVMGIHYKVQPCIPPGCYQQITWDCQKDHNQVRLSATGLGTDKVGIMVQLRTDNVTVVKEGGKYVAVYDKIYHIELPFSLLHSSPPKHEPQSYYDYAHIFINPAGILEVGTDGGNLTLYDDRIVYVRTRMVNDCGICWAP